MATLLHQAVELAQQGRRQEARDMLWQYIQSEPNNEVAWLWLASVAADQAEYVRALNEVLRINPNNAQAQGLLADFQRQYGTPPASPSPGAPSPGTPPPGIPVPGTPPQAQPPAQAAPRDPYDSAYSRPAPSAGPQTPPEPIQVPSQGYAQTPAQPPTPSPPQSPPPQPVYTPMASSPEVIVRHEHRQRRGCLGCGLPGCLLPGCGLGGCGCWQGCLLLFAIVVLLPALACGALSYTNRGLGPLDWPGAALPGDFGRKTVEVEGDGYTYALRVPRMWYLAEADNVPWELWRDVLDESITFAESGRSWDDYEAPAGRGTILVETEPLTLSIGGDVVALEYQGINTGSFACDVLRGESSAFDEVIAYDDGLCGFRQDNVQSTGGSSVFVDIDPPAEVRTVAFAVPVDADSAARWQLRLPEELYDWYSSDITRLIETLEVRTP